MEIRKNLAAVEETIQAACKKAGRKREEITLVAVSKTNPAEAVNEALSCGQTVFGENRVQELREKVPLVPEEARWHLIGTLQTNKVKYLPEIRNLRMIHSVDSLKLAQEIDRRFAAGGRTIDVLLEVNMAHEETKAGLAPEDTKALFREVAALSNISVKGLMTIAPFTDNAETNRRYFKGLRGLLEELNRLALTEEPMTELSMGMSGDFGVAIEEGATLVRVGTAIFGARNYDR